MKKVAIHCHTSEELDKSYDDIRNLLDQIEYWECSKTSDGQWVLSICIDDKYEQNLLRLLKKH